MPVRLDYSTKEPKPPARMLPLLSLIAGAISGPLAFAVGAILFRLRVARETEATASGISVGAWGLTFLGIMILHVEASDYLGAEGVRRRGKGLVIAGITLTVAWLLTDAAIAAQYLVN